jgi:RsmE family RNA methyltransferase
MNRILFDKSEIVSGVVTFSDARAEHAVKVLHVEKGQILKTGEIDGLVGTAEVLSVSEDGDRYSVSVRVSHDTPSMKPWIDLVLAPPRPRVMKRLLPQLASLGVGRIVLVGAKKVEKDFWGATLLKSEIYKPLLVDGLMQSGSSVMPEMLVRRAFRRFVSDELDSLFDSHLRYVAHPSKAATLDVSPAQSSTRKVLLAVGPEGGWTEDEVSLLEEKGFVRYSLGPRILRTDTALVALIARLMERYDTAGL